MAYVLFRSLHLIAAVVLAGALIHQESGHRPADQPAGCQPSGLAEHPQSALRSRHRRLRHCALVLDRKAGNVLQRKPCLPDQDRSFLALTSCLSYAAIFFNRHRKTQAAEISVPTTIRLSLRCAMLCLTLIPFLAWAMARGLGLSPN